MKLFHTLLAVLLFVAIISIDAKSEDCPEGYEYGGVMKIMDLTDCCELWAEYCYKDMYVGIPGVRPKIFIQNWYYVATDPECDLTDAGAVFIDSRDLILQTAAEVITPQLGNGVYEEFEKNLNLCEDAQIGENIVVEVVISSCLTDPYKVLDFGPNHIGLVEKTSKCSEDSGTCIFSYSMCYEINEDGKAELVARLDSWAKSVDGVCPPETTVSTGDGNTQQVNCNIICD